MNNSAIDQELADLLGDVDKDIAKKKNEETTISDEGIPEEPAPLPSTEQITLPPHKIYLKKIIEGEEKGEYTARFVQQLDKAINSPVKEDRTIFRQRLISTFWNFLLGVAGKITSRMPIEKLLCVRFGVVDIDLLNPNQAQMIKSIPMSSLNNDYPFYYMDEWLKNIAEGKIKPSMMDETQVKKTDNSAIQEKIDRKMDSRGAILNAFKSKASERTLIEKGLQSSINSLLTHPPLPQYDNMPDIYTPEQKEIMNRVNDDFRKLKNLDNYMLSFMRELRTIDTDIESFRNKMGADGGTTFDSQLIENEFNSLRQMIKMCAGPRGNHFPMLISDYAPSGIEYVNTRENVIKLINDLEKKDAEVFVREFKNQKNRIVPYILLLPGYGDKGVCWEPFDIRQRATSRGRIALPLYPRNPMYALLNAVADLRWQVAKEKAAYRWMEEGLTGKYYNYFTENKLKGNIKDAFVRDYIIWITQEWNGTQKLEREPRNIFWRYIAFPQSKKDELKNRGFFYNELYRKDQNRAMSDGY